MRNHIVALALWSSVVEGQILLEVRVVRRPRVPPPRVIIRGAHFSWGGKNGSSRGGIKLQLMAAPLEMAPKVKKIIGDVVYVSVSLVICVGSLMLGDQSEVDISRME